MQWKMGTVLRQRRRLLRSPPGTSIIISLATFLSLWAFAANAAERTTQDVIKTPAPATPTATPVPPPPAVIPVAEIATQATQVGNLIRGFATNIPDGSEIKTIRKFLPQVRADTDLAAETVAIDGLAERAHGARHQASECPERAEDAAGSVDPNS